MPSVTFVLYVKELAELNCLNLYQEEESKLWWEAFIERSEYILSVMCSVFTINKVVDLDDDEILEHQSY